MAEPELEVLLALLITRQPKAQQIWEGNMREACGDDWHQRDVWPLLIHGYDGDPRWHCGFVYSALGGGMRWALRAVRRTPADAVRAMLEDLS